MAVIDAQVRSATATAVTDVEVAFLRTVDVRAALERCPVLGLNLMREIVHRMREFNQVYTREVVQAERLALVGRFARSIVHDFKNPLNVIGISADMAAMANATPEMRTSARARIRRQVDRLSNMITELLEFTRGSGAAVVLARLPYPEFMHPLIDELRHELAPRAVLLELENEVPNVTLAMDPRRLGHVFHNLVNNACDAMPDGGTIFMRFETTPQELITELRDTGKGIAPEIAGRLFEAFATYGKASGTGLGLSICKRIVEDHYGRITARNSAQGGAQFSISLPIASSS
jgi:signal transduction histidine kinase